MKPAVAQPESSPSVAFASYVDNNYLEGFEVLIKSLLLTNPWVDHDFIIFYDDLKPESIARISLLYPNFVFRRVDGSQYSKYSKGDLTNYLVVKAYYILEAFRVRDYDRLVTLDVDMVVLGDIKELVDTDVAFGAVPQHFESRGGWRINSGVMTFDRRSMSDEFVAKMDEIGLSGEYDLERHDQGVLSAVLDGEYEKLDKKYNFVKRAVKLGQKPPADTRILHFTGSTKPWSGGEAGYAAAEDEWHEYDIAPALFWRRYLEISPKKSRIRKFYADMSAPFASLRDEDLGDPRAASGRYGRDGDFATAETALRLHVATAQVVSGSSFVALAANQQALSKRANAELALTLAMDQRQIGPAARSRLADLQWVYRDYDAAEEAALSALTRDPTQRKARLVLSRIAQSRLTDGLVPEGSGAAIGHVAFYVDDEGNFGDVMLPIAVRTSIETVVPDARWSSIHAHQIFDEDRALWANKNLDAIVIGGGGLFLPDTSPNGNSGWQWNVTDAALDALEIPIIVYTVGFNLFPGQSFYGVRFEDSVSKLVQKAAFVGLRNHGSVKAVKKVVGKKLAAKIEFLPCVTTVHALQAARPAVVGNDLAKPVVYVNIAFDRASLRFGELYEDFVAQLAEFVEAFETKADVRCLAHANTDERIVYDLRRMHDVRLPVDPIYGIDPSEALGMIERAAVVVGMRGHAGMIPFGVGTPIVSVISHAKLRYFLEDVGHLEWGLEATDPEFGARLSVLVASIIEAPDTYEQQVVEARRDLWNVVNAANSRIADVIESARTRS